MNNLNKYFWQSFSTLVLVLVAIKVVELGLTLLGRVTTNTNGVLRMEGLSVQITSENWDLNSVLLLYLFPFVVLFAVLLFLNKPYYYPIRFTKTAILLKAWGYQLLLIHLLLGSAIAIFTQQGLYHPLSWLGWSVFEQYTLATMLLGGFIFGSLKLGKFWAPVVNIEEVLIKSNTEVKKQLFLISILPCLVLAIIIFTLSGFSFNSVVFIYLIGLTVTSLVVYYQVSGYDVIVR